MIRAMSPSRAAVLGIALALGLAACGGGDGGGSSHPLGEQVVVEHAEASGKKRTTTLGLTVTEVRKGTQKQLKDGGFNLDPEEETSTPYYVGFTIENQGSSPIEQTQSVGMDVGGDASIRPTIVIELGGKPFQQCPQDDTGDLAPGATHERCLLYLVPEGSEPERFSFLPYDPDTPTEFVYWEAAS
jgi:hypothetical protein